MGENVPKPKMPAQQQPSSLAEDQALPPQPQHPSFVVQEESRDDTARCKLFQADPPMGEHDPGELDSSGSIESTPDSGVDIQMAKDDFAAKQHP